MKVGFALFALVAAEPSFEEWAAEYGVNGDEKMKATYEANVQEIERLNKEQPEATFAVNQFSGMTFEEFEAQYLTLEYGLNFEKSDLAHLGEIDGEPTVGDVDWDVTPVKDQKSCGSCWAFGTMGSIEHAHKLKTGKTVSLAEQQLVDCDKKSSGCNGGRPDWAMTYLKNKNIYTTSSYPYKAKNGSCKSGTASGVQISGYKTVSKSESALLSALGTQSVTVMIKAENTFQHYKSGIVSGPTTCGLNHAVLATGYGSNFIKIKNSWGSSWGENGFIRVKRTTSGCGPFGIYYDNPVVPTSTTEEVQV
jgi:hypothetical protein